MPDFLTEYPQFFTASIKGWYKLLEHDKFKDVIINSLRFLADDKRINLYPFVIMSDHIHLTCRPQAGLADPINDTSLNVQGDFLSRYVCLLNKVPIRKFSYFLEYLYLGTSMIFL